jgi:hypothetical protein
MFSFYPVIIADPPKPGPWSGGTVTRSAFWDLAACLPRLMLSCFCALFLRLSSFVCPAIS